MCERIRSFSRLDEALALKKLLSPSLSGKTKKDQEDAFNLRSKYILSIVANNSCHALMANNPQYKIITGWERQRPVREATAEQKHASDIMKAHS